MTPATRSIETMPHGIIYVVMAAFTIYGAFTVNPLETIWTGIVLLLLLRLWLWKSHPGVFLYLFLIQLIESHVSVFEANSFEIPLNELFPGTGQKTFWLASTGLIAAMLGCKAALSFGKGTRIPTLSSLQESAQKINQSRLLIIIFLAHGLTSIVDRLIPYGSSLSQFETYINGIPTAFTLAFGIHFFLTRQRPLLASTFFLYLLGTSFYSYFSSWKDPLILVFVASLVSLTKLDSRAIARLTPLAIPAFALVLTWQSIKMDYREFLSGGANDQNIVVSQSEALTKFSELASESVFNNAALDDQVINSTYRRAGYLEYFSAAVGKVPTEIPHQQGALLLESAEFALIPRILNPNKGIKNDRAKVERFTDYYFGSSTNKSSFSLGHYCEAYIDWGSTGMLVQLFLYGSLGGFLFRLAQSKTQRFNPLISIGITYAILFYWGTFQQDAVTIIGKTFWGSICHLLLFIPVTMWMNRKQLH